MRTRGLVLGSALIGIGLLFLLEETDAINDAGAIIADWWPVIVLVAAAEHLLDRDRPVGGGLLLAAVGAVLLAITTDLVGAPVWSLVWPVVLILVGVWLLARPRPPGLHAVTHTARDGQTPEASVRATAFFSSRRVVSTARPLAGGAVTALFGAVDLDLTGASIEDGATIEAAAIFGGVDITVPHGWRVVVDGPAIFGGTDNTVPPPTDPAAPTLRVDATALFGGIEVRAAHDAGRGGT